MVPLIIYVVDIQPSSTKIKMPHVVFAVILALAVRVQNMKPVQNCTGFILCVSINP